jgi:thiamine biosynthesis lipoprotein
MGTTASFHVNDQISAADFADIAKSVEQELQRLEEMFSVFRETSEISRINAGTLHHLDASSEVIEVLDHCVGLEQKSNGAFSIRRAKNDSVINPSGFVKGWAGEHVANQIRNQGVQHFYVGIGGDFACVGGMTPETPWRFGITDPYDASQFVGTVEAIDGAVATSGIAERGHHIWDPRSGKPADAFASVTVVGPQLMWADAYATTIFVMGESGLEWLTKFPGYDAMAVPVRTA